MTRSTACSRWRKVGYVAKTRRQEKAGGRVGPRLLIQAARFHKSRGDDCRQKQHNCFLSRDHASHLLLLAQPPQPMTGRVVDLFTFPPSNQHLFPPSPSLLILPTIYLQPLCIVTYWCLLKTAPIRSKARRFLFYFINHCREFDQNSQRHNHPPRTWRRKTPACGASAGPAR